MITDLILKSLISENAAAATPVVPVGNIYFDRAQQPSGLSGFPYMLVFCEETAREVRGQVQPGNTLVTYTLTCQIFTAQGMPGSSGDQVVDMAAAVRALEDLLNFLPPNEPWNYVTGFLHCLKKSGESGKDPELYLGKDVYNPTNEWTLLVLE